MKFASGPIDIDVEKIIAVEGFGNYGTQFTRLLFIGGSTIETMSPLDVTEARLKANPTMNVWVCPTCSRLISQQETWCNAVLLSESPNEAMIRA